MIVLYFDAEYSWWRWLTDVFIHRELRPFLGPVFNRWPRNDLFINKRPIYAHVWVVVVHLLFVRPPLSTSRPQQHTGRESFGPWSHVPAVAVVEPTAFTTAVFRRVVFRSWSVRRQSCLLLSDEPPSAFHWSQNGCDLIISSTSEFFMYIYMQNFCITYETGCRHLLTSALS